MDQINSRISKLEQKKPNPLRQKEIDVLSHTLKDLMEIYRLQDLSPYEEMDARSDYPSHGPVQYK